MPNQPVFGTLYTLDRFVYRQNSTVLYCTIKEIIILKIACFGVIYVPFSRVITRYNVYFFTRVATWPGAVQLVSGRPRHPQLQGLVEQAHYTLERMMSSRIAESASNSPPWTHWLPHIVCKFCLANVYKHVDASYSVYSYSYDYVDTINAQVHSSTKHIPFELVFGQLPRSVVVPDVRLKGLINEEDLVLTGEMENAQDTSDVDHTTVELTLQHNSVTTIQHSSLDSTHDSSPTVLDTVQYNSPSIHDSIHDSAPTVLDNIHHSPPSVKESMFDSSPTLSDAIQHSSCSRTIFNSAQDVTSNDSNTNSKLCDGVSRFCNSESETEEKDKTLLILDSEAKTEDQFEGRQKQLATIEKHRLVYERKQT